MGLLFIGGEILNLAINRKYETMEDRVKAITRISDIRYRDAFKYYKERFAIIDSGGASLPDSVLKKLYINDGILNNVIEMFVSQCPTLTTPVAKGKQSAKKSELIKLALQEINWTELNKQIYDLLEGEGDVFFYIYFDDDKVKNKDLEYRIPKLKLLDSKNITAILTNEANKPKAYFYKEKTKEKIIDYSTGEITEAEESEVIYIFEKGKVHKIEQEKTEEGTLVVDEEGKVVVKKTSVSNKDSYKELIPIIHVSSNKYQNEVLSVIPADEYVEVCLKLDQIITDIRATNRNLGFPRIVFLDCKITQSDNRIGGVIEAQTIESEDGLDKKGQIIDLQLKNGQDSTFKELNMTIDRLYDKAGLINPSLMMRVGSSDSSKMFQQVTSRTEDKIKGYVRNIIEGFEPYFKILLSENGLYEIKNDLGYSFDMPEQVIKNSVYDELLIKQLSLNTGLTTIREELKKKGYTEEQIEAHLKNINEEYFNGKNDISVKGEVQHTVDNANNVEK